MNNSNETERPQLPGATEMNTETNAITFVFKGATIRTFSQDGELWFVLADVCAILGLSSPHKVAERLDDDQKGRSQVPTLGGSQLMQIVNESGLYDVIIRSDKPEAKTFRKWVTSEVLPAIRKTGSYSIPRVNQPPKAGIQLIQVADQFEGAIRIANLLGYRGNNGILSASNVVEEMLGVNPAKLFKAKLDSGKLSRLMSPTELGQELGAATGKKWSAQAINNLLVNTGLQIRTDFGWEATPLGEEWSKIVSVYQHSTSKTHTKKLRWYRSVIEQLKGVL